MTTESPSAYRPAGTLVAWVILFLAATALLDVVAVWSGTLEIRLLDRAADGAEITDEEANRNDDRQGLIGMLQIGSSLPLVVLFCVWVHRANSNARALGARDMAFSPGWSVGWYFVPIANLWKPYQAMKEIYAASNPDPEDAQYGDDASPVLGVWWALWILSGILGNISFRLAMRAEDLPEITTSSWVTLAADVVEIPAAFFAYLVVSKIHDRQESKHLFVADGE